MPYKNENTTNQHKWLVTLLSIIGVVLLVLYFGKWHQVKTEEKYLDSYLMTSKTINYELIDISEIDALIESPGEYFVYISYTEDKEIYNFEKNIKPIIDNYKLNENFYFLNTTKIKTQNNNYKNDIATKLNINAEELDNIPVILYFKDKKLIGSATSQEDFEKLVQK